jgi:hypothetical protein
MQEILDEIEALFMSPRSKSDAFFVIDRDGETCENLASYRTACTVAAARSKDTGQQHFVVQATSVYVPQVTVKEYPSDEYPDA